MYAEQIYLLHFLYAYAFVVLTWFLYFVEGIHLVQLNLKLEY